MLKKVFIAVLLSLFAAVSYAEPSTVLGKVLQRGRATEEAGNLGQIGISLMSYAEDHNAFPEKAGAAGLDQLNLPKKIFIATADPYATQADGALTEKNTSYLYLGNIIGSPRASRNLSALPLVVEKPNVRDNKNYLVLYADGHIGTVKSNAANAVGIMTALKENAGDAQSDPLWPKLTEAARNFDKAGR